MSFQRCSVCDGVGIVRGGYFIRAGNYNQWVSNTATECCRPCEGTGLIDELIGLPPAAVKIYKEGG